MKKTLFLFCSCIYSSICFANPFIMPSQMSNPPIQMDLHAVMKMTIIQSIKASKHDQTPERFFEQIDTNQTLTQRDLEHINLFYASTLYMIHGDTDTFYKKTRDFRLNLIDRYEVPVTLYSIRDLPEEQKTDLAYVMYLVNLSSAANFQDAMETNKATFEAMNFKGDIDERMIISIGDMLAQLAFSEANLYLEKYAGADLETAKEQVEEISKRYFYRLITAPEAADLINGMLLNEYAVK